MRSLFKEFESKDSDQVNLNKEELDSINSSDFLFPGFFAGVLTGGFLGSGASVFFDVSSLTSSDPGIVLMSILATLTTSGVVGALFSESALSKIAKDSIHAEKFERMKKAALKLVESEENKDSKLFIITLANPDISATVADPK